MKEIEKRYMEYTGWDCYYFTTICKCWEKVWWWSEWLANKEWEKHICK